MSIKLIKIEVPEGANEVLKEQVNVLIENFCRRLSNLSGDEQLKYVDELNHFITFYDPEHLIRP